MVCKCLLLSDGDLEGTVLLGPLAGPVLLTLLLSPLYNTSYHGNYMDPLLPHQPPEVSDSVWEGTCKGLCQCMQLRSDPMIDYLTDLGQQCTSCAENSPVCQMYGYNRTSGTHVIVLYIV